MIDVCVICHVYTGDVEPIFGLSGQFYNYDCLRRSVTTELLANACRPARCYSLRFAYAGLVRRSQQDSCLTSRSSKTYSANSASAERFSQGNWVSWSWLRAHVQMGYVGALMALFDNIKSGYPSKNCMPNTWQQKLMETYFSTSAFLQSLGNNVGFPKWVHTHAKLYA